MPTSSDPRDEDDEGFRRYALGSDSMGQWLGAKKPRNGETYQHIVWLQTGLNESQVLLFLHTISHGVLYHSSKWCVKCGVNGKTQVCRPFETLHVMGHS